MPIQDVGENGHMLAAVRARLEDPADLRPFDRRDVEGLLATLDSLQHRCRELIGVRGGGLREQRTVAGDQEYAGQVVVGGQRIEEDSKARRIVLVQGAGSLQLELRAKDVGAEEHCLLLGKSLGE